MMEAYGQDWCTAVGRSSPPLIAKMPTQSQNKCAECTIYN